MTIADRVLVHAPEVCGCGRSLRRAPVVSTQVRQVFDLPEISLDSEIVANPRPSHCEIAPPPGPRSWSTTLTAQQAGRPWRQAQQLQQPAGLLHLHG